MKNYLYLMPICLFLFSLHLNGQVKINETAYNLEPKKGIYQTKSLIQINQVPLIKSQIKFDRKQITQFLYVENQPIFLFEDKNGLGEPIGYLSETSIVEVDTIFYNQVFQDTSQIWNLTFDVWSAIKVNNQKYYTDYRLHDFIAYKISLPATNQTFLLIAQSTGYDYYYDYGYPNVFFVVILDKNDEIYYKSKVFNYDYGDEFWDSELGAITHTINKQEFSFTIHGLESDFLAIWNGKKLIYKQQNK